MSDSWPMVPLGNVIRQRKEFIRINDLATYKRCRVQLHAKGIVLRDIVEGQSLKTKEQQICRAGEFLVAEIDAKVGGFGIVPQELDGAIVSSHYFLFVVDEAALDGRFLGYFIQTPAFQDQVTAQGSTNYAAIRPQHVLDYRIPLPPLPEQRRIVARTDELAALIEEARALRARAREELQTLLSAALHEVFSGEAEAWDFRLVEELCEKPQYGYTESAQTERVGPKFLRITDIQNGMVNWDTVPYCACDDVDKYRIQSGDILFARTGATTGKSFLVRECPEAVFASYLIRLRLKPGLEPEYLYWFFQSPQYWAQVYEEKKGSAQANMNGQKLSNVVVPVAPDENRRHRIIAYLDDLQAQVDELTALQQATQAELDALLPSVLERAFRGEL